MQLQLFDSHSGQMVMLSEFHNLPSQNLAPNFEGGLTWRWRGGGGMGLWNNNFFQSQVQSTRAHTDLTAPRFQKINRLWRRFWASTITAAWFDCLNAEYIAALCLETPNSSFWHKYEVCHFFLRFFTPEKVPAPYSWSTLPCKVCQRVAIESLSKGCNSKRVKGLHFKVCQRFAIQSLSKRVREDDACKKGYLGLYSGL